MKNVFRKMLLTLALGISATTTFGQTDPIKELQEAAIKQNKAEWGYWGPNPEKYSSWTTHSNRLIPVYSYGISLDSVRGENSIYRSADRLANLYGHMPTETTNPKAIYFDQTDIYHLQKLALANGKKKIVLMVFDGMDWQTSNAAAIVRSGKTYSEGKGAGLSFQDYQHAGVVSDFGYMVTSPANEGTNVNVDDQKVTKRGDILGGYAWTAMGEFPWSKPTDAQYPIGKGNPIHAYTDSSSSASSMTAGVKIYNNSVNVDSFGRPVVTLAQQLQEQGFAIGITTSVPVSHATPACAYAVNVHRDDFQDLTNDLLGVPSISHPGALPGVDVLIGCGWGQNKDADGAQGKNFVPGNRCLTNATLEAIDESKGGKYVVAQRTAGQSGQAILQAASQKAIQSQKRLFGYFGTSYGHLPFQTADGKFDPTISEGAIKGKNDTEVYTPEDINENPTLSDMTRAALDVLNNKSDRWWLMVEAGDVDWANHSNNIDNSVGAVFSGADAFSTITKYFEEHKLWDDAIIIVTADHGHYFNLTKPEALIPQKK